MTYDYWLRALAITGGKRPLTREEMSGLGISEDEVGCGFYRMRSGPRMPFVVAVAIWEAVGSAIVATVNGDEASAHELWLQACKFPVEEAEYRHRIETGSWPDENPVPVTQQELDESEKEFPCTP